MNRVSCPARWMVLKLGKLQALLLLLLWSFSLAHVQCQKPDLEHYGDLARQAVADELKRQDPSHEPLSIELVGQVIVPPDHASLHRPGVPTVPVPAGQSPPWLALVGVHSTQRPLGYLLVTFWADGLNFRRTDYSGFQDERPDFAKDLSFLPAAEQRQFMEKVSTPVFTVSEREQVTHELAKFWDAWVDISRGPERLAPFLADEIACVFFDSGTPVKVSMDGRSCASGVLDILAFQAWDLVEGNSNQTHVGIDTGHADELIRSAAERHALIRSKFRDAGMFDARHQTLVRPYLGVLLREGTILKFSAAALKMIEIDWRHRGEMEALPACKNPETVEQKTACLKTLVDVLPAGAHYVVFVHQAGMVLFFGRQGPSLRLVGIFGAGG